MNSEDKNILTSNASFFRENMVVDGTFEAEMTQLEMFTDDTMDNINSQQTKAGKADKVVEAFKMKGPKAMDKLLSLLEKTCQGFIAEKIQKERDTVRPAPRDTSRSDHVQARPPPLLVKMPSRKGEKTFIFNPPFDHYLHPAVAGTTVVPVTPRTQLMNGQMHFEQSHSFQKQDEQTVENRKENMAQDIKLSLAAIILRQKATQRTLRSETQEREHKTESIMSEILQERQLTEKRMQQQEKRIQQQEKMVEQQDERIKQQEETKKQLDKRVKQHEEIIMQQEEKGEKTYNLMEKVMKELKSFKSDMENRNVELQEAREKQRQLQGEKEKLEDEVRQLKQEKGEQPEELQRLREKIKEYEEKIRQLQTKIVVMTKARDELNAELTSLKSHTKEAEEREKPQGAEGGAEEREKPQGAEGGAEDP